MGLLQDFAGFIGEVNSLKDEFKQTGVEVVTELVNDAEQVSQTIDDTATSLKESASDIKATVTDTTSLTDVQ